MRRLEPILLAVLLCLPGHPAAQEKSGNVVHTAQNRTKSPVRVIFFEVLPAQWSSPSVIPPKVF